MMETEGRWQQVKARKDATQQGKSAEVVKALTRVKEVIAANANEVRQFISG